MDPVLLLRAEPTPICTLASGFGVRLRRPGGGWLPASAETPVVLPWSREGPRKSGVWDVSERSLGWT